MSLQPTSEQLEESAQADAAMRSGDIARLLEILTGNNSRRFVSRILHPFTAPVAVDDEDPEQVMTHKMAWGEADGKYYAFPTVMEDPETGGLMNYGDKAFDEAVRRRDFLVFDNPKDADWFTKGYKRYWDEIGYQPKLNDAVFRTSAPKAFNEVQP